MPSFFKHDRSDYLFPIPSHNQREPVLPVTPLTRNDIENQLKRSLEQRNRIKQIYLNHTPGQLKRVPSFQLFSEPTPARSNDTSSGSLSLRQVPEYSLFRDSTWQQENVLTMQVDQYTKQRQEAVDDQGNARPIHVPAPPPPLPPPISTQDDILQEVLNDASLWSSSSTPVVVTPQDTTLPATVPISAPASSSPSIPISSSTHVSPAVSISPTVPVSSPSIPSQYVPILATPLQKDLCNRIAQQSSAFDKISFERMIGILNHPVVAMADDYEQVDAWDGSGKTKFIKLLVELLQKEQMTLRIAIATYDNDTETFLYNKIKTVLHLPCQRINSVLDDVWEREYGIVFETQNSGISMRDSKAEADFIIAFDIRLRPGNPIFSKISSKRGSTTAEIIWLFTVGSIEQRAIQFFNTHADDTWTRNWWSNNAEYRMLVRQNNTWPSQENATEATAESVVAWIKNGCSGHYMFIQPQRAPTPRVQEQSLEDSSDMDIDDDNEEQHDLPDSVKAQVKQFFRYPSLRPSFDRPQSRATSPRNRNRNNRWRETEYEEDEDDVASFYSANEYVQDIKPIPISDADAPSMIGNSISSKLCSLKPAFEKEYQSIISRLQAQYNEEVKAVQAKYEQLAFDKLRDMEGKCEEAQEGQTIQEKQRQKGLPFQKKRKTTVKAKPIQVPKRRKISKQLDDQAQKLEANINKLSGELTAMLPNVPKAERERADLGHEHRPLRQQKPAPVWDYALYGRLKSAQVAVVDLEQTVGELKKARAKLDDTDRAARGFIDKVQEVSKETAAAEEWIKHALHNGSCMNIRGVDLGLVTVATISTLTLQDAYGNVASHVSGSTTSSPLRPTKGKRYAARHPHGARSDNTHAANRSRRRARQIDDTKKRSKEKRTREIQGVTYHCKLTSAWREGATTTFNGSYRPINSRIKDKSDRAGTRNRCPR
ncbi:hypothetical protein BJV82DRAFT_674575 [Fennellomyces sp. T-0311]|nr:hypothetical protein BJV82DRAFT_674575 [Fennellomyces sp. T-0311]